ncbi:protoporphyrinogen/coproporphyrinogen oxidase [Streptomonospora nanhaiensis]|uniref:Oxygen-dependent protoporphyrinogen oxidase n=1 Tax=Streptomonospora nanhaiensis TaxID=1323731 RepID=A0A853BSI7_9ACTN|nr:FAD-dependent oxidoreductase [Streptomonospora nanhaiensis]MBV2366047.1 FAD-dependent oxidoreductase [Streptomonospora nanhaiensis]NYI97695.1 oxygen-dependent protoporphyrinogen oxidase [Streptomonospora nanhaiensis]
MTPDLDVAVVGAGVAGLATARALARAGHSVRVLEAADAVGGRMRTVRRDGCLVDTGAEMIAARGYPATWALIRELGLTPDEVPRVPDALAVWHDGRARLHAGRPLGLLTGAGLPVPARWDLVRLLARARAVRADAAEHSPDARRTVAELAADHHPALADRLLAPLVRGFFGWRPERASAAPLLAHLAATGSTAAWCTYRDGMDTLARRLARGLDVATGHPVREVAEVPGGARVAWDGGGLTARAVVLAVPAPAARLLHPGAPPDERGFLDACAYAPMLRVSLTLDRPLAARPDGRGFAVLVPASADPVVNVVTVDHRKHPGRAPAGRGLVSVITTPEATAELLEASDTETADLVVERAEPYLPGLRAALRTATPHRFPHGLPEPTPEALRLRPAFLRRPLRAVEYAGDWLTLRPCSEGAAASALITAPRVLDLLRRRSARATEGHHHEAA